MIIRFSVENFMSFNDRVEFSMAASKITRMKNHVISRGNKRLLKGGFVFGANASGKSNLIEAIDFSRKIVVNGISNVDFDKKFFRIQKHNYKLPGVFQFDFMVKETVYSYGFAVSYVTKEIIDEWLYRIDGTETCIFSRETNDDIVNIGSDLKADNKDDRAAFEVYKNDFKNKNMRKALMLSDIANRSSEESEIFKAYKDVYEWFLNIVVIYPDSKFGSWHRIIDDQETCDLFSNYLNYFDTGIERVKTDEMEFDRVIDSLGIEEKEELKLILSEDLVDKRIMLQNRNNVLTFRKNDEGDILVRKIVFNHGNPSDLFDNEDESDGTRRLFDLIPLFFKNSSNSVIIIDEVDRSLHSKLTVEFIKLFYELSENLESQLIVTTHDANLMDLDLVRQDEIWFVERQRDHSSKLYSLNKFKERYDKKVSKDYLIGRYGAVPVFSTFNFADDCNKEE